MQQSRSLCKRSTTLALSTNIGAWAVLFSASSWIPRVSLPNLPPSCPYHFTCFGMALCGWWWIFWLRSWLRRGRNSHSGLGINFFLFILAISTAMFLLFMEVSFQLSIYIACVIVFSLPFSGSITTGTASLPILFRALSVFLSVTIPAFARNIFKEDAFIIFHFIILNLTIFSSFWVYCKSHDSHLFFYKDLH